MKLLSPAPSGKHLDSPNTHPHHLPHRLVATTEGHKARAAASALVAAAFAISGTAMATASTQTGSFPLAHQMSNSAVSPSTVSMVLRPPSRSSETTTVSSLHHQCRPAYALMTRFRWAGSHRGLSSHSPRLAGLLADGRDSKTGVPVRRGVLKPNTTLRRVSTTAEPAGVTHVMSPPGRCELGWCRVD